MPADTTLYSDVTNTNVIVAPSGNGSLIVPVGNTAARPSSATNGMMRYNTDAQTNGQLECYSGGKWRAIRFVEQGQITQQNLGAGDSLTTLFGPLNSTYYNPSNNANNATIGAQNIIVVVENVIQLSSINYTVVQNPSVTGETYNAYLSAAGSTGSTTLYFNTSLNITNATGNGTTATLTFAGQAGVPFAVGSTITVTGITPTGYNGVFTVTASTNSTVSYANTTSATYQNGGNITASGSYPAVFPAVNITGATVSGTGIYSGSTISSYTTDPNTDALTSITLSHVPTSTIAVNTDITITEATQSGTGYYLQFTSPVPYGKVVIALLGFDS
jgi:hypothetical protein